MLKLHNTKYLNYSLCQCFKWNTNSSYFSDGVNVITLTISDDPVCLCVCFQGQACVLVLRAMQIREVQQLLGGGPWAELCTKVTARLVAVS